ncbi:peptidoglycan-recognition protein SD-like isoform X2 [Macrosteles quadrilineatus]|uniref:peptidoglycan-recognition protein SD-like isoform X2 n=1 Tax=Macrosteles quadrilineatus TaxID=74068 RepID=UPI0023E30BED|nr:peptidoglycan-recognition protein SD-like isoform X2 [Macrosteles quadrilineatus]
MPILHDDPAMYISLVTKAEWEGKPALGDLPPVEPPVPFVRYTYTSTETCKTLEHCSRIMQDLQKYDTEEKGLPDIRYNFVVGGDGKVYEGRGWEKDAQRPPEFDHLKGKCIDIAYCGNYKAFPPSVEMLKAGLDLLRQALMHQMISPCFEIIPYKEEALRTVNPLGAPL